MIYNGNSYENLDDLVGTPILGHFHVCFYPTGIVFAWAGNSPMHDASMALTSHPQPKDASSLAELARQRGLTEKEMKRLTKTHSASAVLPSGALIQEPLGAGSWRAKVFFFRNNVRLGKSHWFYLLALGMYTTWVYFFWGEEEFEPWKTKNWWWFGKKHWGPWEFEPSQGRVSNSKTRINVEGLTRSSWAIRSIEVGDLIEENGGLIIKYWDLYNHQAGQLSSMTVRKWNSNHQKIVPGSWTFPRI